MASPTINTAQAFNSTSLSTIMNLARSICNDTQAGLTDTPGEGQILTNDPTVSPFTIPFLVSSIREVYRELRNVGQPTLIKDNVIVLGLPIINSPTNGPGGSDPSVQTFLSTIGYFDGVQMNPEFLLPDDVLYMETVWERQTGTNNNFVRMDQPQDGLPSCPQGPSLRVWEWRNDNINFIGATQKRDIRMRYYCALNQFLSPNLNFDTTYVPILDSTDAIAYKLAVKYARMLGSPGLADLQVEAKEQMFQLKNATTRRAQSIEYIRMPYGHSSGDINNDGVYTLG